MAATEHLKTVLLTICTLCLIGDWHMMASACLDITTHIPCIGVLPAILQPPNNRVCYSTEIETGTCSPERCVATEIQESNQPIEFTNQQGSQQAKIWSPGNLQGSDYQNERLCRYHAVCPPGFFTYYSWLEGNFVIEDADPLEGCLDYLLIETGSGTSTLFKCGYQSSFSDVTSRPLRMEFRSNTEHRYLGFQIDVLCVNSQFTEAMQTTNIGVGSLTLGGEVTNSLQGGRSYFSGCQKLPNPTETVFPPIDYSIPHVSRLGRKVEVPRGAFIDYQDNVLAIVAEENILRTIDNINILFFYTGYNGTHTFRGSAPLKTIYGGGALRVFLSVAYYATDRIPPQFEPNRLERDIIGILLNATKPFFTDEGGTTTNPPPGYMDSRVDLQALSLAQTFQNACNIFLREAARSYLNILAEWNISVPFHTYG